jgi:hypothetical protein
MMHPAGGLKLDAPRPGPPPESPPQASPPKSPHGSAGGPRDILLVDVLVPPSGLLVSFRSPAFRADIDGYFRHKTSGVPSVTKWTHAHAPAGAVVW